jgi:membrane-bound lytic murein transglycosylase D
MAARTRRRALALGALAAVVSLGSVLAARSPSLRTSVHAAYRAFRDPALLDPPPPPPAAVSCARLAADDDKPLDLDLSRAVDRPLPGDLDDPDGAAIHSLTLPDLRVPITRRTMRFVRFLARTSAGRAAFLQRHRRASLYRESIAFALREAGLPEDLLWLAAVESAFDPRAVSPAGAAGLWQFMPDTGQLYGLDQSPWVDERRSLARSTQAAVTHLRDLYERFGRWDLALAAYNAGYDRVAAALEKVAAARGPERLDGRPLGFADLAAARALPEETINYVPQIMAFALVAENRSRFGLDVPELAAPIEPGEIAVPEGTRLRTIARAAGVSVAVLREYNPQLLRDRVPPAGGDYLVALPESRVPRALASFPAYNDQEVVAQNEGDTDEGDRVQPLAAGMTPDRTLDGTLDADDPLPRRPVPLGHNRLPEIPMPGRDRVLVAAASFGLGVLEAKLTLAMPDLGWKRLSGDDPLGFLGGQRGGAMQGRGIDPAIDRQLAFLEAPAPVESLRAFTLPSGITVRVRRDKGALTTAITVRVATVEDAGEGSASAFRVARRGADAGAVESLSTMTVDKADADAGIELAATRLRIALGDTRSAELAEIRFRAGNARRKLLQQTPYGPAWLALGEGLFPPDHPLAGTVLGAGEDGAALRDMLIAESMQREQARARASITVVGDVDELRTEKLAEAFLASVSAPTDVAIAPHPREDRITVEDEVPSPRALVGWIGPGEGEVGDASLRVAVEMLESSRVGLLHRALVARAAVASTAHAALEVWPRASIAAVELAPAPGHEVGEVLAALDRELGRLGGEGPDAGEVAVAKFLLHARLEKERAAAATSAVTTMIHSAGLAKLRHTLRPWAAERVEKALDEVTVASVRTAVKRVLAREHRVVVTTVPRVR